MKNYTKIVFLISFLSLAGLAKADTVLNSSWSDVARGRCDDQNSAWWSSDEAIRIARNVLLYQKEIGGWQKNTDFHLVLSDSEKSSLLASKSQNRDCTIDNGAVSLELTYLSRVYGAVSDATVKSEIEEGFLDGVGYLIEMQYDNGGWPQFYPLRGGYSNHVTYNDNAMINVMEILRHVYQKDNTYTIKGDDEMVTAAKEAFDKGLECILNTQYVQNGKLTVWCAQHHYETLEPALARSYELPSLSGSESVGIINLLMSINNPSDRVKRAVYSAVKWFEEAEIFGKRVEKYTNSDGIGDLRVVDSPNSSNLWARFYDLETNKPFFCDRDGIKKNTLAEIGHERRNGYSWYGSWGSSMSTTSTWFRNNSKTIFTSPFEGQIIFTADDTTIVRIFANRYKGTALQSMELTLDGEQTFNFSSAFVDTLFVGLEIGDHTFAVKATFEDASTETDEVAFKVEAPRYGLVVNRGEGDGEYHKGTVVDIEAEDAREGFVFDKWVGDTTYVEDPFSASTTITMPGAEALVTALYAVAPELDIDNDLSSNILFYPNPTKEVLTIDLTSFGDANVEILSLDGRKVFAERKSQASHAINIGFLAPGQYVLVVSEQGRDTFRQKLLVVK